MYTVGTYMSLTSADNKLQKHCSGSDSEVFEERLHASGLVLPPPPPPALVSLGE